MNILLANITSHNSSLNISTIFSWHKAEPIKDKLNCDKLNYSVINTRAQTSAKAGHVFLGSYSPFHCDLTL